MNTTQAVEREMAELPVENMYTAEEVDFDDLTIPGDDSDYYI